MTKIRATLAAIAVVAATLIAAPAQAADWCTPWKFTDNDHTVATHCDQGPGDQYRTAAYFCGPSGCWWGYGAWKTYGAAGKSTAHSDYGTVNSQIVNYR